MAWYLIFKILSRVSCVSYLRYFFNVSSPTLCTVDRAFISATLLTRKQGMWQKRTKYEQRLELHCTGLIYPLMKKHFKPGLIKAGPAQTSFGRVWHSRQRSWLSRRGRARGGLHGSPARPTPATATPSWCMSVIEVLC